MKAELIIATSLFTPCAASGQEISFAQEKESKPRSVTIQREEVSTVPAAANFARRLHAVVNTAPASKPLIIRTSDLDEKAQSQLTEDLAVMARILEKTAATYSDHDRGRVAAGIHISAHSGAAPRALYLEDYGVVFTLNVTIPLQPETKSDEGKKKSELSANAEWETARNEIFGPKRGVLPGRVGGGPFRGEFSPRDLEEFRGALIDSLRNAANIRGLKESDWITVVVRGPGAGGESDPLGGYGGVGSAMQPLNVFVFSPAEDSPGSTLVLRVRKGDADAFVSSQASLAEFKQKISVATY